MTQPQVTITELDGALGVLPPSAGRLLAIVGVSSSGPFNTPATFARVKDVQSSFGAGPMVEAAAHFIERYGRPVLLVRTEQTGTAASVSAVDDHDATGTSVVTVHTGAAPVDDYELALEVLKTGTVGTAGITYRTSLDGGRTWTGETALGTATVLPFPGAGVSFDLGTGGLVAGELYTATAHAAKWSPAELGDALDALRTTLVAWELVHVVGAIDADAFDAIELAIAGMSAAGKYHGWVGNTRVPNAGESESAYLSALAPLSAAKSSRHGSLYAGACKLTSSVSGRKYRRPVAFPVAAREASVSEEVNTADVNVGALDGVSIRDVNGNPDEHDESINPGLDDLRFGTLRTWDGYQGVYVNRPRLFSPSGSDFQLMPHRRVLNLAHDALRLYFVRRLNKPVLVSRSTGYILEAEALEIELGATAALRSVLLAKPKASDAVFTLSRTDNLLSTNTMNGQARVIPLAYPEFIELDVGFLNPALRVQAT